jgi:MFS family permease
MHEKGSIFFPIYLSMGVLGLSLGLTLPLLALSMKEAGATASVVGTSTMLQSTAAFIASLVSPTLMFAVGNKRVLAGSLLLCGVTMGLYALAADIPSFFVYRALNGFAMGAIFVATEATLIAESDPSTRARTMGIYMMSLSAGAALGPVVGFPLFEWKAALPYLAGAGVCLASCAVVVSFVPAIKIPKRPSGRTFPMIRIAVPLGSALVYGFILEGIFALVALYLKKIGLSPFEMGTVVASFDLGGIILLYPLTRLADAAGKMRFIAAAALVCTLFFLVVPSFPIFLVLAVLTFVGGGIINAIYPVGLAIVGDELTEPFYPRAAALLGAAFYMGGIGGPVVLSRAMDLFGYDFLFYAAAASTLLFSLLPLSQAIRGRR